MAMKRRSRKRVSKEASPPEIPADLEKLAAPSATPVVEEKTASPSATPAVEKPVAPSAALAGADRRIHPRYEFIAAVEVVQSESGARIATRVRDLSL